MCCRYFIGEHSFSEDMMLLVETINRGPFSSFKTSGDIHPTDAAPVLANSRHLAPALFAMRWGYTSDHDAPMINARSETAAQKPMFQDGMNHRRCVIPATHYYEWSHSDPSRPKYAIRSRTEPVTYLAGLYRIESGLPEFTILTRTPAQSIRFLHDRMPVILPAAHVLDWLNPSSDPFRLLESSCLDVTCTLAEPVSQLDFFSVQEV